MGLKVERELLGERKGDGRREGRHRREVMWEGLWGCDQRTQSMHHEHVLRKPNREEAGK